MQEAKHTPGPWEWENVPGAGIQVRGPYKGSTRLLFSDIWRQFAEREWDAEMEANARLIAAAPELLEALQGVLKIERGSSGRIILESWHEEVIRNEIAKATGKEI